MFISCLKRAHMTRESTINRHVNQLTLQLRTIANLDMRRYERVMQHQHAHNLQEYLYSVGNVII